MTVGRLAVPTSPAGKSKFTMMQMAVAGLFLSMGLIIVHMYRTIDNMYRDQQAMRMQIAELSGTSFGNAPIPTQNSAKEQFLESRSAADIESGAEVPLKALVDPPLLDSEGFRESRTIPLGAPMQSDRRHRRLLAFNTIGTAQGVGCFSITNDGALQTFDVSSATACNGFVCPDCFTTPPQATSGGVGAGATLAPLAQNAAIKISACSSAVIGSWSGSSRPRNARAGLWTYTFINTDPTYQMTVVGDSGTTYTVEPNSWVQGYCGSSNVGTDNRLIWPSTNVPTLTVNSGLVLQAGNFDASTSSGTFATSTGAHSLNGDVTITGGGSFATGTGTVNINGATTNVANGVAWTFGSSGASNTVDIHGTVTIGDGSNGKSLTHHGAYSQVGAYTFSTGTDAISLNGETTVAQNMDFKMGDGAGSGIFQTGAGTVSLMGDTTIGTNKMFTTGTGQVSIQGATVQVADNVAWTFGSDGSTGTVQIHGDVTLGSTSDADTLTHHGNYVQGTGSAHTFSTSTGAVSLNGDVTVVNDKNLKMGDGTGTGVFMTGAGTVSLMGNTRVGGDRTFSTATGAVSLNGPVTVIDGVNVNFGVTAASAGDVNVLGNFVVGTDNSQPKTMTLRGDLDVQLSDAQSYFKLTRAPTPSPTTPTIELNAETLHDQNGGDFNLLMNSNRQGRFQTATGDVNIYAKTTISDDQANTVGLYLDYTGGMDAGHTPTNGGIKITCDKSAIDTQVETATSNSYCYASGR